jgi:phosphoribosyl-ATP pyrophosphohydrolase/phosphoribosyl-AMP cyclohydrolase
VDKPENLAITSASGAELALDDLAWDKQNGLLPAIVQDVATLRVLMLGFMDRDALRMTLAQRTATFFSRSRGRLWTKGETSGNVLDVVRVASDCDRDSLLLLAHPRGPTCHVGTPSCFCDAPFGMLAQLDAVVAQRERERPAQSYTTALFKAGVGRIAQKVGEEGVEVALAAATADDAEVLAEAADLAYHLVVLLRARGLSLRDVEAVLAQRHANAN